MSGRRLTEVCGLRVAGALAPMGRTASGTADLVMEAGRVTTEGQEGGVDAPGTDRGANPDASGLPPGFLHFDGLARAVIDMREGTASIDVCAAVPPGMDEVLAAGASPSPWHSEVDPACTPAP